MPCSEKSVNPPTDRYLRRTRRSLMMFSCSIPSSSSFMGYCEASRFPVEVPGASESDFAPTPERFRYSNLPNFQHGNNFRKF
uniref:Uncharacterized protein n=1 Tax=Arundo donax TaxID=35708 RepID=A0A0A8ZNC0_ARUDO